MYKALQDSIGTSEKLDALTDFQFRVWTYGLAKADILGRLITTPKLFKAICMPLSSSSEEEIEVALQALHSAGLVHLYEVGRKRYGVYHDQEENGTKNLKYRKSSCPPPNPSLCYCVEILDNEKTLTAVSTAVPTAVPTADVLVPVLLTSSSSPEDLGPEQEFKGPAAGLAIAWNRGRGEKVNKTTAQNKIQAALDFGVPEADIRAAFKTAKGEKIWEILDVLRKARTTAADGRRFAVSERAVCANCGGSGETPTGPCPGCPKGRAKRRAQG